MPPSLSELTNRYLHHSDISTVGGEVEPYDVFSAFRVEPRTAWQETLLVFKALGVTPESAAMPREWAESVRRQKPRRFIPMAAGYYPQMVSELSRFFESQTEPGFDAPCDSISVLPGGAINTAFEINQAAADFWHQGKTMDAIDTWLKLPDSPLKSFNLGMAYLSIRDRNRAIQQLTIAKSDLSDVTGWHALAGLYLALAQSEV